MKSVGVVRMGNEAGSLIYFEGTEGPRIKPEDDIRWDADMLSSNYV